MAFVMIIWLHSIWKADAVSEIVFIELYKMSCLDKWADNQHHWDWATEVLPGTFVVKWQTPPAGWANWNREECYNKQLSSVTTQG